MFLLIPRLASLHRPTLSCVRYPRVCAMSSSADSSNVPARRGILPQTKTASERPVADKPKPPILTMQIIVRRDLQTQLEWPMGPLMAQAAHAATAVLEQYKDDENVKAYLSDLGGMRKVVMEIPDEESLRTLEEGLKVLEPKVDWHTWVELPENIPTAIALVPNTRPKQLKKLLDSCDCRLWA